MPDPLSLLDAWPATTVAAGLLEPDGTRRTHGPAQAGFALASLTKPLVALAVLVAVEEGTIDLDRPLSPRPEGIDEGITPRHLLAHASGLAPDQRRALEPPGRRRIYSNAGFELLGQALEQASGLPVATYLAEAVVAPLGLTATELAGSPAHGARSSVGDLLRVSAEVLAPTLVHPDTIAQARTEQFPGLAGVLPGYGRQDPNPWGLGFEIRGSKRPHWTGSQSSPATFGHFGRAGTLWWIDPERRGALVVLTDQPFGPWALERWPALTDAVLASWDAPTA